MQISGGKDSQLQSHANIRWRSYHLSPKPRKNQEAELETLTNNYDDKYFIGRTQFGKLYREKIDSHVTGAEYQYDSEDIERGTRALIQRSLLQCHVQCMSLTSQFISCCLVLYIIVDNDATSLVGRSKVSERSYCKSSSKLGEIHWLLPQRSGEVKGTVYDLDPIDTLHNLTTKGTLTVISCFNLFVCKI